MYCLPEIREAVEAAVLNGLGDVLGGNRVAFREVGNRPRDAENAVVRTGGQTEPLERAAEHRRRLLGQRTEIRELRRGNGGVADVLALAVVLPLPGGEHTGADGFRGFLLRVFPRGERLILDRLHGDLEVDAVEKRPGQAAEVLLHGFLRAGAALRAVPAARTGIHRGNQLKIGGVGDLTGGAGDGQLSVLHRLAQHLERVAPELGQLVEKQHTPVGEGDFAGQGKPPRSARTARERDRRGRMMGCAERTLGAFDGLLCAADRRPDTDDVQPLLVRQRRQNGRKPLRHHAFARAGRAGEQHVMPAGRRDFERPLDEVLTEHMGVVEVVLRGERLRGRRTGRKLSASAQVVDELAQRPHRVDGQAVRVGRLLRVFRRHVNRLEVRAPRCERHGERTAHRAQLARKRQLAEEQRVLRQGVDFAGGGENGQQNGQVVGCSGFSRVGRGEVDRQARHRPVERAGLRRRPHALSGLADRAGRQTHDVEPRQSPRKQTFDRDDVPVDAGKTGGKYARYHLSPPFLKADRSPCYAEKRCIP